MNLKNILEFFQQNNAIDIILQLLQRTASVNILSEIMRCLGNIAAESYEYKELIIEYKIINILKSEAM